MFYRLIGVQNVDFMMDISNDEGNVSYDFDFWWLVMAVIIMIVWINQAFGVSWIFLYEDVGSDSYHGYAAHTYQLKVSGP